MALSLLKIVGSGSTNARPTVKSYTHKVSAAQTGITSFSIAVADFTTDSGGSTTALTLKTDSNGYYMLYINGVLQPSGMIASVAATKLKITAEVPFNLLASAPITLTVTNFAPVTTFAG